MQNTLFIVGKIFLFSDLLVTAIVLDVNDPSQWEFPSKIVQ